MTQETSGLLEAVGDLWRLAAVVGIAVLLLAFRRPITDMMLRTSRLRFQRGGIQVEVEANEQPPLPPVSEQEAPPEKPSDEASTQPQPTDEESPESSPRWRMMVAVYEGRRADAEAALAELQESATTEAEKKGNEVAFLGLTYRFNGDIGSLLRLEELANDPDVRFQATETLGSCLESAGEHARAAERYKKAAALLDPGNEERGRVLARAARALALDDRHEEAHSLLRAALEASASAGERASIFIGLGDLYGVQGNQALKAIVLEQANTEIPGSPDVLFSLAYAYSEAGYKRLALLHYDKLVALQHLNDMAQNNYGVVLDQLGFPGKSADAYRRASELANTLAMANMANRLRGAGFLVEAEAVLERARTEKEVHANIGASITQLDQTRNQEAERLTNLLRGVRSEQQFMKEFGSAQLASSTPEGTVKFSAPGLDLVVSKGTIYGTWVRGAHQYAVAQPFPNRAEEVRFSTRPVGASVDFVPAGSLLALVDLDFSRIRVMWPDGTLESAEAPKES